MKMSKQSGQVLIGVAFAVVVLAGFAGLAIDMGTLRYQRRLQQTAADAAAIAGAQNLVYASGVTNGARTASSNNDFTDSDSGAGCTGGSVGCVSVTVNNPPTSGPHATQGQYVEAIVTAIQPTYFMRIFGVNSRFISARAVATNVNGGLNSGCLYTLNPPTASIEGIGINGSVIVNAPKCGIVDNGNYNTQGSKLIVNAGSFAVAGSRASTGSGGSVTCTNAQTSCPIVNAPASSDPLSYLTPPGVQSPNWGNVTTSGTQTLSPGTYGDLTIGKNSIVTMNPGIYYFNGPNGFSMQGGGSVTGNGVMLYFTGTSTINTIGGGSKMDVTLSPMTTGPYAGILMYQDPNDLSAPSLGGDDQSNFTGALYFPSVTVTWYGDAKDSTVGMIISAALAFSGNPTINITGDAGLGPGVTLLKNAVLVE
jgi:hypothetical protein